MQIEGLPAGDYDLLLKRDEPADPGADRRGRARSEFVLGRRPAAGSPRAKPLQIAAIEPAADSGDDPSAERRRKFARVHVFATRLPAGLLRRSTDLAQVRRRRAVAGRTLDEPESLYVTGRNIGDEYRYILDRKYAKKFPATCWSGPACCSIPGPSAARRRRAGGRRRR